VFKLNIYSPFKLKNLIWRIGTLLYSVFFPVMIPNEINCVDCFKPQTTIGWQWHRVRHMSRSAQTYSYLCNLTDITRVFIPHLCPYSYFNENNNNTELFIGGTVGITRLGILDVFHQSRWDYVSYNIIKMEKEISKY
jgi:hypothetical protein